MGRDVFYRGEIARAMAADFAANGSAVSLEALGDYVAEDSRIVRGSYRGYDLIGMDVPAAGSVTIQALHTTHLSTADANGMFVSLTQTLGPNMGSKVVTPGLGFLYASTLGGYLSSIDAGVRARSNISPLMVSKDGEVVLVLGAAGGGMIPPAVVHAVTRVIDFGMSLPEALAEPRVAFSRSGYTAETSPDIGWTDDEVAEMRALGIEVTETPWSGAFGRVHGVQFDPQSGTWVGAADPDWEGSARGPDTRR